MCVCVCVRVCVCVCVRLDIAGARRARATERALSLALSSQMARKKASSPQSRCRGKRLCRRWKPCRNRGAQEIGEGRRTAGGDGSGSRSQPLHAIHGNRTLLVFEVEGERNTGREGQVKGDCCRGSARNAGWWLRTWMRRAQSRASIGSSQRRLSKSHVPAELRWRG